MCHYIRWIGLSELNTELAGASSDAPSWRRIFTPSGIYIFKLSILQMAETQVRHKIPLLQLLSSCLS